MDSQDMAVALGQLPIRNLNVHIKPWCTLPYGDRSDLRYHVRFCLEGIPTHAWNKSIAKKAVVYRS